MRRRIRSAALPLHRHALPQLAVDGALVALAYYLAFQLRFDSGPSGQYEHLREATIWWVLLGSLPVAVHDAAGNAVITLADGQSITLNGVTSNINQRYPPGTAPSGWWGITANYQMDGNYKQNAYTVYLDEITFSYQ